jgi:capsular exopolysaccharide synthesis family protein
VSEGLIALQRWFFILRRRWWILLLIWGGWVGYSAFRTWTAVKIYRAQATIEIHPEAPLLATPDDTMLLTGRYMWENYFRTQEMVLRSRSLHEKVVQELPAVLKSQYPATPAGALAFGGCVDIEVTRNSFVLKVGVTDRDPEKAMLAANTLVEVYVREANKRFSELGATRADHLVQQTLPELKQKLDRADRELRSFQESSGFIDFQEQHKAQVESWKKVGDRLRDLGLQRVQLESQVKVLQDHVEGLPDSFKPFQQNGVFQDLMKQRADLSRQLAERRLEYKEKHPVIAQLLAQIAAVEEQIRGYLQGGIAAIKIELETVRGEEAALQERLKSLEKGLVDISGKLNQFRRLEMEWNSARDVYNAFLRRYGETTAVSGAPMANIRVVDPARAPGHPWRPAAAVDFSIALLVGLILGLSGVYVSELVDNRVRSSGEVEAFLGMDLLAVVPVLKLGQEGPAVIGEDASWTELEPFRRLRIELSARLQKLPDARVVSVVSSAKGEGKTTVANNLARAIARQGLRVLLVDADLRLPRILKLFRADDGPSLVSYLKGERPIDGLVRSTSLPGLFVAGAQEGVAEASELVGSSRFFDALKTWRDHYDLIILDSPPVLAASESRIIARASDAAVMIVRERLTRRHAALAAKKQLTALDVRILGAVVNCTSMGRSGYGYGYGYGYDYGYGQKTE